MILGEKSERRNQSSFSFLKNVNFWKSLPWVPEFEYPPLHLIKAFDTKKRKFHIHVILQSAE